MTDSGGSGWDHLLGRVAGDIGMDPADLGPLLAQATLVRYDPGDWLFHEGAPRQWMGIVVEGEVEVVRGVVGTEVVAGRLGPGALISESFVLGPGDHLEGARTRTGASVEQLHAGGVDELRTHHPVLVARLVNRIAAHLGERLAVVTSQLARRGRELALFTGTRVERDSLGPVDVPTGAYYGAQTVRALRNFALSGIELHQFGHLVDALAFVKKAAALANAELGVLSPEHRDAIVTVCDEILAGKLRDQFVVDMFQGGAGTSTNMNINEVIANRGLELLGHQRGQYEHLHPNDHVNRSQSTNDVYPTATKIAAILGTRDTAAALDELQEALAAKAAQFSHVIKMGRTEMQDAVPMTLGQEFGAYAGMVGQAAHHLRRAADELLTVSMGATAIGTGLNSPYGYADLVTAKLVQVTGLPVELALDLVEATQDSGDYVGLSAAMKRAAVQISKICNDLRLLSSGPRAGFNEIRLPPMQPGSSIMPGKVNPVIPEVVSQICFQIMGYDVAVSIAAESSQLELNMAEPLIAFDLMHGLVLLRNAVVALTSRCVIGIEANEEVARGYVERSIGLVTALVPYIGYERSVAVAHEAMETDRGVYELVLEKGWMPKERLDEILSPANMTHPRRPET